MHLTNLFTEHFMDVRLAALRWSQTPTVDEGWVYGCRYGYDFEKKSSVKCPKKSHRVIDLEFLSQGQAVSATKAFCKAYAKKFAYGGNDSWVTLQSKGITH